MKKNLNESSVLLSAGGWISNLVSPAVRNVVILCTQANAQEE
jgi:hypothetical protein